MIVENIKIKNVWGIKIRLVIFVILSLHCGSKPDGNVSESSDLLIPAKFMDQLRESLENAGCPFRSK